MGNSSGKEGRASSGSRVGQASNRSPGSPPITNVNALTQTASNGPSLVYTTRTHGSRQELIAGAMASPDGVLEPRKETKQERDARKAEKERVARAKERERSLREENIDGGYLVTLGTYTGAEDFGKAIVRQLMIERRLAPFWRGLDDHSDAWTEHQLVAMARGLPLPAPDAIPNEEPVQSYSNSTQPIAVHGKPLNDTPYEHFSALHGFLGFGTTSPSSTPTGSSPLFRSRSKTLASLTTKNGSQTDLTPQETRLPHEPYINGQPLEAYLYKDASECPICFLYYPPYLNRTRCCDQPICSECFVQIKRPDPHPPEHADPSAPAAPPLESAARQAEEGLLMSEPAQCPFCVQPEFGVTYEAPPFRRGLTYAVPGQAHGRSTSFIKSGSPMASSTSLAISPSAMSPSQQMGRRRATSLSANATQVITTDKVRPDWAKKLSDARAQAARRSAAATALHNAAYLMGGLDSGSRLGFGRRRRQQSGDVVPGFPVGVPIPNMDVLLSAIEASTGRQMSGDDRARLGGSRVSRTDDLEELMLMEAIRQSLVAEEDRKRKEDRDAAKTSKKEEKNRAKEQKKADKAARKNGSPSSYRSEPGTNGAWSSYTSPSRSGRTESMANEGKGKAKVDVDSPTDSHSISSLERTSAEGPSHASTRESQRHLEQSRANLSEQGFSYPSPSSNLMGASTQRLRNISDASDSASSLADSVPGSLGADDSPVGNDGHGEDFAFDHSPTLGGQHLPYRPIERSPPRDGAGDATNTVSPPAGAQSNGLSLAAMMVQQQASEGTGHGVGQLHFPQQQQQVKEQVQQQVNQQVNQQQQWQQQQGPPSHLNPDHQLRGNNFDTTPNEQERTRIMQAIPAPRVLANEGDGGAGGGGDAKYRGSVSVLGRAVEETQ